MEQGGVVMFDKLRAVEKRYEELESRMSDPEVVRDRVAYQNLSREHAELNKIVSVFREYKQTAAELDDSLELLRDDDPEIKALAREEIDQLNARKEMLAQDLKQLLIPKDPLDAKNVILEIRAGTGGEEAGLFASDLFAMPNNKGGRLK